MYSPQLEAPTRERPHGLRYALTLHDPGGKQLLGYDNAHRVRTRRGKSIEAIIGTERPTIREPPTPSRTGRR